MSLLKRYFLNRVSDYEGETVNIAEAEWKQTVLSFIRKVRYGQLPDARNDGGLYIGSAGIAYMYYHVARSPIFAPEKDELLVTGMEYLQAALRHAKATEDDGFQKSAFMLGNPGVFVLAAAYYHELGQMEKVKHYVNMYVSTVSHHKPLNSHGNGGDELFVGRAGYLAGVLFLEKQFGKGVVPFEEIREICDALMLSGTEYSNTHKCHIPLMYSYYKQEYLGAAHGLSGILQMLMCFPEYLNSTQYTEVLIKNSVDALLQLQTPSSNFHSILGDTSDEVIHWCHGAAGVVYLMAKAYLYWGDDKYLQSCVECSNLVWHRGLLNKGPGICHGIAGSGYVFLLMFRLTGDQQYLYRAKVFAEFLFSNEFKRTARRPDRPFSLFEGLAGTVCFLADLLCPQKAEFPLFDIF